MKINDREFWLSKIKTIELKAVEIPVYLEIEKMLQEDADFDEQHCRTFSKILERVVLKGEEAKIFNQRVQKFVEDFNKNFNQGENNES